LATSNTNFFIAKNGLAVGNSTNIKAVVDNSGHWVGVPIADDYARQVANGAVSLAQSAYDYANTISGGVGTTININTDETTNNIVYIDFTHSNSGNTNTVYTSNSLTYNPFTSTIGLKSIDIQDKDKLSSNTNISANTLPGFAPGQLLDSFDATKYRSVFYQIQINHLLEFHILNLAIVHDHPGTTVYQNTYGEIVTTSPLGTFVGELDMVNQMVNVYFNPTYSTLTDVTFSKTMFARMGITVPVGDLGFVLDPVTVRFDAGNDLDPAVAQFNYGSVP
jgi:hypothetical protein